MFFNRIKENNTTIILIIDDLDRVDPDHIFRILNIFSAHFDDEIFNKRGQKNKFGFDKIIVVCDYNNIQSLFKNRYGQDADFGGYIDKFYSRSVFQFNIKQQIEGYFRHLLYEMDTKVVKRYSGNFRNFGTDELFEKTIIYSILYSIVSIRILNKLIQTDVLASYPMRQLNGIRGLRDQDLYTLFLLKLNIFLFGGIQNFINALELLETYNFTFDIDRFLVDLIYKVDSHERSYEGNSKVLKISNNTFEFTINEEHGQKVAVQILLKTDTVKLVPTNALYLDIIKHFLNKMKQLTGIQ